VIICNSGHGIGVRAKYTGISIGSSVHRLISPFIFGMALFITTSGPEIRTDLYPSLLSESSSVMVSGKNPRNIILADRVEKEDRVVYGTDSDPAYSQEEQEKEEKKKEEKSWRMLEHMNLYQNNGKKVPPQQSNSTGQ
jgi:hypothetical protein